MNKLCETKCVRCKEKDAAFTADCLVVDTSTTEAVVPVGLQTQRQYLTTESVSGNVVVAGLCPECMKKVSRNIDRDMSLPFSAMMLYILLMLGGIVLFFLALAGKLGRMINVAATGGLVLTFGGIAAYVIHKCLLPGQLRKNAPWQLLGKPLGAVRLSDGRVVHLVPVGQDYYKDFAKFSTVNGHLVKEIRQRISTEVIDTGAWKALVEKAKADQATKER